MLARENPYHSHVHTQYVSQRKYVSYTSTYTICQPEKIRIIHMYIYNMLNRENTYHTHVHTQYDNQRKYISYTCTYTICQPEQIHVIHMYIHNMLNRENKGHTPVHLVMSIQFSGQRNIMGKSCSYALNSCSWSSASATYLMGSISA